jgi:hypothetical protein
VLRPSHDVKYDEGWVHRMSSDERATMTSTNTEFAIKATELRDLLASVIPLMSTDASLPVASVHLMNPEAMPGYLVAVATDRYVAGMRRAPVTRGGSEPFPPGWSITLDGDDAKRFLAEVRGVIKLDRHAVAIIGTMPDCGVMIGPAGNWYHGARWGRSSLGSVGVDPIGYPDVPALILNIASRVNDRPLASGLDPRLVGKFAVAAKIAKSDPRASLGWWDASEYNEGMTKASRWVLKFGDDFIGIVMGMRVPDDRGITDISHWEALGR